MGDDFVANSYGQYFQNAFGDNGRVGYIKAHYDVTGLCNARIKRMDGNILNRLRNLLVSTINDQILLPKAIVVIIDEDLMYEINHFKHGISAGIGRLNEWLANQFHRMITAHKEKLPSKARKFKYPTFLWTTLVTNITLGNRNEFREKFNKSICAVTSLFREMQILDIQGFEFDDTTVFTENKLNARGLTKFWNAVNDQFEIWDRDQMRKDSKKKGNDSSVIVKKKKPLSQYRENCSNNQKYKWDPTRTRFKLPKLSNW